MRRRSRIDLQAKVSLVLVGVILPTFVIVTVAENKLTQPILEEEVRQLGIVTAKNVASDIAGRRLLTLNDPTPVIESSLQELLYSQPSLTRVDVVARDPVTGQPKRIASSVEEEGGPPPEISIVDTITTQFRNDEEGRGEWVVQAPIEVRPRGSHNGPRKVLGTVQVVISTQLIGRIMDALWRMTVGAAAVSTVVLIGVLSFFLRKTIANDRLLRRAESHNLVLTEQLHEAERELMVNEKFAVMGQLTASFAHEIGTPLNAIGGHLQLLREEMGETGSTSCARLGVIEGQIGKIEGIVKGFLQSTSKPASQKQLTDLNQLVARTLAVVAPRIEALAVESKTDLDRSLGPVRAVPLDVEQILLNLVNNSLDSLKAKASAAAGIDAHPVLEIGTSRMSIGGRTWAVVTVQDTGMGIPRADLPRVIQPFFTTKRPGEGTGLGLAICQELARKHGGSLELDSKEGAWTQATLRIPYQAEA